LKTKSFFIPDKYSFLIDLQKIVDFSVSYKDFRLNPYITESDYFGQINNGNFKIYDVKKALINKRILLVFTGEINSDNKLKIKTQIHNIWLMIFNNSILLLIGFLMIFRSDLFWGIPILFISLIQLLWEVYQIMNHQAIFFKKIATLQNKIKECWL
jgi:hypothetical protein